MLPMNSSLKYYISVLGLLPLLLLSNGCSESTSSDEDDPSETESPLFTSKSPSATGLSFYNRLEENIFSHENVLTFENYYNGSGVAAGDLNNDGLPDIYFGSNTSPNALYKNLGNWKFEAVEDPILQATDRWTNGVSMADVNQDGLLDIYIACGGPSIDPEKRRNKLFINEGNFKFREAAAEYGVDDSNWSTHSSFFDYDGDGDLDLFVMNHTTYWGVRIPEVVELMKDTANMLLATNHLYRNDGEAGFTDVTIEAGILAYGYGLGLATTDINNDGLTDIYVANDYSVPDFMYINRGDGTFVDEQKERTRQITYFGMGVDVADLNNDLSPEILVVDMAIDDHYRSKTLMASMNTQLFYYLTENLKLPHQYMFNSLQFNDGTGHFVNVAHQTGLAKSDWSWTALMQDFDGDSYKDIFISNGIRRYPRDNDFRMAMQKAKDENGGSVPNELKEELFAMMPSIPLSNEYYRNRGGDMKFDKLRSAFGNDSAYTYGVAYADFDQDGDLDLVMNNIDDTAFVFENTTVNNFLRLDLRKSENGPSDYNAKAYIKTPLGWQYQELSPIHGYFSSMEPVLYFGVEKENTVEEVWIKWSNGSWSKKENVNVNQTLTLVASAQNMTAAGPDVLNKSSNSLINALSTSNAPITHRHYDEPYNEFAAEILLPHSQGRLGPSAAVGDANGDGLDDLYLGGGKHQAGALYFQNPDGSFDLAPVQPWTEDFRSEDMGALFFDFDNDGDQDLYVCSGGGSEMLQYDASVLTDRLYENTGNGEFTRNSSVLPNWSSSTKVVTAADIDNDGDLDLFVGGRTSPAAYPTIPASKLLINENGVYKDKTIEYFGTYKLGMIAAAEWADFNGDDKLDLVLAGEWMPISLYLQGENTFEESGASYGLSNTEGWWHSLLIDDFNGDGTPDIIAGNLGENNKFHPSLEHPLFLFANNFDGERNIDIVLAKEYHDKLVPVRGRECSSQQMPFLKDKFPQYADFASASLEEIYGKEMLDEALQFRAVTFSSTAFMSSSDGYEAQKLPFQAQLSPVNAFIAMDLNADGRKDLMGVGNHYITEPETPRYDAGSGFILLHNEDGSWTYTPSGLYCPNDAKDLKLIRRKVAPPLLVVPNNADTTQFFELQLSSTTKDS
ncbi:hypothetical protein GCM10011318_05510 [Phaeocystidibacter marisrubri]|uniref:VCBS repeat-containing protein n=2 Tax=Phaeocystidibacter marisrubri TaxID=1577780 RepID=A0A6L3ZEX0_9FLAO|nr:VCBS repeat-containing protein [Phaeocystidibacter marisrubri]GGH67001.1 hypothetical protein GCM10011318_05510 [Phaeocystidibacter marisrubri]